MDQPGPVLGQVAHPGLAKAVADFTAAGDSAVPGCRSAQLLYGYVLLNMTGNSIDSGGPYGTTVMAGSTLSIQTLVDKDDRPGLAVYTSQAEIHKVLSVADLPKAASMAQAAGSLFELLDAMNLEFVIDPGICDSCT